MFQNAAIIGVGQSAYTRRPEPGQTTLTFMRDAVVARSGRGGGCLDIQGMAVASFSWRRMRGGPSLEARPVVALAVQDLWRLFVNEHAGPRAAHCGSGYAPIL
jgi:hypothetical protein